MIDFLDYLHESSPTGKKHRQTKMWWNGKKVYYHASVLLNWLNWLNWRQSATDSALLILMGLSAFIPVHKLWLYSKLCMYSYELRTIYNEYSRIIRLFIDTYIIFSKICLNMSDTSETFSNLSR